MNGNEKSLPVATVQSSGNGQGQSQKIAHADVLLSLMKRYQASKARR